jgi:hypothetical protein
MENLLRPLSVLEQPTPTLTLSPVVKTGWLLPYPVGRSATYHPLAGWGIPIGLGLLCFYGRLFVLAALHRSDLEWTLLGGVLGILVGWPAQTLALATISRGCAGQPHVTRLLTLTAWASLPLTLRDAVQSVYMLTTGQALLYPGLSGLLPVSAATPNPDLLAVSHYLLGQVDLYKLAALALLVFAVREGAQLSTPKALLVVSIYSILSLSLGTVLALL